MKVYTVFVMDQNNKVVNWLDIEVNNKEEAKKSMLESRQLNKGEFLKIKELEEE